MNVYKTKKGWQTQKSIVEMNKTDKTKAANMNAYAERMRVRNEKIDMKTG